MPVAGETIHVS